jgi:hypothetical protein
LLIAASAALAACHFKQALYQLLERLFRYGLPGHLAGNMAKARVTRQHQAALLFIGKSQSVGIGELVFVRLGSWR